MTQEKSFKSKAWEFFQSLGKTFMFPVSLLAFMGLLLGIGSSVTSPSTIKSFPFLGGELTQLTFGFIAMVGGFAFTYLPLMFAMAIPMGLARRNEAVGAFAGFVGYMLMNMSINYYLTATHQLADAATMRQVGQSIVLGIQTLEMGVLGGIVVGVITYFLHERFQDTVLHDAFAFFSGTRFVPLLLPSPCRWSACSSPCCGNMWQWALPGLVISSRARRLWAIPVWRGRTAAQTFWPAPHPAGDGALHPGGRH